MANGRLGPRGEGAFRRVLADMAMDHGVGVNAVADAAPLASVGRRRALGRRDGRAGAEQHLGHRR
ncbi:MAG: hypothetical protein ACXWYN_06345 [Actinomycetota bacterium]